MKSIRLPLAFILSLTYSPAGIALSIPRHSTRAACEAMLLNLSRSTNDAAGASLRVNETLARVTDSVRGDESEYGTKLLEALTAIADRTNFHDADGFAMTEVYHGTSEVREYLSRTEEFATRLETEAFRLAESRIFNAANVNKSVRIITGVIGGLAASLTAAIVLPLALQALMPVDNSIVILAGGFTYVLGGIVTGHTKGPQLEWALRVLRAYRDQDRRRGVVDRVWGATRQLNLNKLKKWITIQIVEDTAREWRHPDQPADQTPDSLLIRASFVISAARAEQMRETSGDQAEAYLIDRLVDRRGSGVPAWLRPGTEDSGDPESTTHHGKFALIILRDL